MSNQDYQLIKLPNGLRVAWIKNKSLLVHCGFTIYAGSRDDNSNPGLAHCLEHMLFKGTTKRSNFKILNHLEIVGGELNAFTTKEITSIYASVEKRHLKRTVDILCDVTFNSTFPEAELVKEKKVIIDEINMYLDSPEENIYDEFQEMVFENHSLAHNILGTKETVDKIDRSAIIDFVNTNYSLSNMVFTIVGNFSLDRLTQYLNEFVPQRTTIPEKSHSIEAFNYIPQNKITNSDFGQAYSIMGIPVLNEVHDKRFALLLLNNLLGGPGMNSRLNLAIREKYGYTYHIESGYQSFRETGLFHCYFSSDEKYLNRTNELIKKEIKKLQTTSLGKLQLHQAKNQFIGQLVMGSESDVSMMLHIGKGIVKHNKALTIKETIANIQAIKSNELLDLANELLDIHQFSQLTYVPEK